MNSDERSADGSAAGRLRAGGRRSGQLHEGGRVDAGQSAVALRRDPPARSRARRAAVPPARSIGRADRRRARVRRARPASSRRDRDAVLESVAGVRGLRSGTLDFVSLSTLAADPLGRLVGRFRKAHPGIVVRIAAPDDVGAVDADGARRALRARAHRAAAPTRGARVGAARTPGDRGGVPAAHPAPGAGPAAGGEAAGHAAGHDAARPVDP